MIVHVNQTFWIEYNRNHERSPMAITFYLPSKPDSRVLLLEDLDYEHSFDYHIENGDNLGEDELDAIVKFIVCFIQPGYYLLTCGESGEQLWRLYWKFYCYSGKLQDTGCLRVLRNKTGQEKTYKILRKL